MSRILIIIAGLALAPAAALAQWTVALEAGVERVPRFARPADDEGDNLLARPTMTWPLSLRLGYGGQGPRVALSASRVDAGLELDDGDFGVVIRDGFRILTLTPELSLPLRRLAGGAELRGSIAFPAERWSFPDLADEPRWRLGVAAGLAAEFPMTEGTRLRLAGQLGRIFGNPLSNSEVTDEYLPTVMWRRALRVGVVWGGGARTRPGPESGG